MKTIISKNTKNKNNDSTLKIVVVGSVAYDTIKTPRGYIEKALGGSAVYFSVVASYFTKVGLVGIAGGDFEQKHINFLKKKKIDLSGFKIVKNGQTFHWSGSYNEDFGDPITHSTCLNVFENFDPELPIHYKKAPFLFLANIHPQLQNKIIEMMYKPKLIALDTMNYWINSEYKALLEVLNKVNILFVNMQEALMLTKERKLNSAINAMLSMGPERIVVKLGELGAITATKSSRFFAPAFPLKDIVDPTGAGDSFAGGFMGYLAKNNKLSEQAFRKAMVYGSVMGSFTCENFSVDTYKKLSINKIRGRYNSLLKFIRI